MNIEFILEIGWLLCERQGSACLCLPALELQIFTAMPDFYRVLEVQTQILMLAQQILYPLNLILSQFLSFPRRTDSAGKCHVTGVSHLSLEPCQWESTKGKPHVRALQRWSYIVFLPSWRKSYEDRPNVSFQVHSQHITLIQKGDRKQKELCLPGA